jgi:phosphoserine aminotransferase
MSYWQTVEVEADSSADAASKAFDEFDITKARVGEGETYDVEEMELIKKAKYVVRNHNGTLLGTFSHKEDAEKDAKEYRYQTGNPAYVDEEHEDDA